MLIFLRNQTTRGRVRVRNSLVVADGRAALAGEADALRLELGHGVPQAPQLLLVPLLRSCNRTHTLAPSSLTTICSNHVAQFVIFPANF